MRPTFLQACAAGASAVVVAATGSVLSPAGAAAADRPDTRAGAMAAAAAPTGRWLHESLSSDSDRDWFRFQVRSAGRALVTLGHLPGNYALDLYDAQGNHVGSADRTGRRFEELYPAVGIGDYFVRVSATAGADPAVDYVLKFRPLADRMVIANQKNVHDVDGFDIKGELLDNTPDWLQVLRIHVTWFDKDGNRVGSENEGIRPGPVAPRQRAEFHIKRLTSELPAGTASYHLRVDTQATADRTPKGLVMNPGAQGTQGAARTYRGTVTNQTGQTVKDVYTTVLEYDSRGRVNAIGYDHIPTMSPGQTVAYAMVAGNKYVPKPNAVTFYATITG